MRRAVCLLLVGMLWWTALAWAGRVRLTWQAPTANEDGSPLTDLAGYTVYYGAESGFYEEEVDVPGTTATITSLVAGQTYYFVVTASDLSGNESQDSNEVSAVATVPDCAYANLARCATASASSVWSSSYAAAKANDGSGSTRWNSASHETTGAWLALDFGRLVTFNRMVLKEGIARIRGYRLQYWDHATWQDILIGTTIGSTNTHTFAALTAQQVRLLVTHTSSRGSSGTPTIAEFEVYE